MIRLEQIKKNPEIISLINSSCECLRMMNYTEHGLRHASYVSVMTGKILKDLGYEKNIVELGKIAGYIHDVGNSVNRHNHGITGALLVYPILKSMDMPCDDINIITACIGNHEEEIGLPINVVSAAMIIADKSDAHRTRVRRGDYDPNDIHDRVNYAINRNEIIVDKEKMTIFYKLWMEETASVMDYFNIYLSRIQMCEEAAALLKCKFKLYINDVLINLAQ